MLIHKHDVYNVAVRLRGHAIQLPKQSERDDLVLAADILPKEKIVMELLRAAYELDRIATELEQTIETLYATTRVRTREIRAIAEYLRGSGDLPEPSRSSHYS